MVKPQKTGNERKGFRRLRAGKIAWLALILSLILALAFYAIFRHPRNFYWSGRKYSLSLQTLTPGGPFADEGWWIRNSWSVPSPNDFRHWQLYGLKLGKHLIRLDILDDPIAAIKRNLPKTIAGLLAALASKDPLVKHCAGQALVEMGPSAQSVFPILLKRYQQGGEEMEWIILELAKTAGTSAVSPLSEALKDADPKIRQKAAEALGEIGPDAMPAVPKLAATLHDATPAVVIASAVSLRKIDKHNHGEVSALIGLLTGKVPQIQAGAIWALGEFGEDSAEAVQPLMKTLESGNSETAGITARTLGLIGSAAGPAIPLLIDRLKIDDPQIRMFTMEALGRFGEDAKAAIPKLLQLADRDEQMWGAISALSSMGTNAVPGLVELYRQGEGGKHSSAARAFMKMGPKAAAAVPALVEDLDSESTGRNAQAAMVLGCIGEKAKVAVPRLTELIHNADVHVRLRAAEALWRLDRQTNAVLPVMMAELEDWSKDTNALRGLTEDEHGQSRQQVAAEVMGEIGPAAKAAVPFLRMMLRSSFDSQKEAATNALKRIIQ